LGIYGEEFEYASQIAAGAVWTGRGTGYGSLFVNGSSIAIRSTGAAYGGITKDITVPTDCEVAALLSGRYADNSMWGIGLVDSSGSGVAAIVYNGVSYPWGMTYSSIASAGSSGGRPGEVVTGAPWWISLRKTGTSYLVRYSSDGSTWTSAGSGTWGNTMSKIWIGSLYNPPGGLVSVHRLIFGFPTL
jgi:hypothetical protein